MRRQFTGWKVKRLPGGGLVVLSALCVAMAGGMAASADDAATDGDKAEIQLLRARLDRLEQRVADKESAASSGGDVSTADKPGAFLQLPSGLGGVQMTGFVDTSYIYNFKQPDSGTPARANRGRVFDVNPNGFTIQAAEVAFEKALSDESPFGFRTDLYFGDDAELIHSTGLGNDAGPESPEAFDLQQAYVTARAPIGSGIDFKLGKFVTLLGAEVIESPANWNFSRSFLFGYAIPFTHTGATASYALGEFGSVTAGVVNGWDIVDDNNAGKDLLGNITLTPIENVTLAVNGITGAQRASDNRNDRSVVDLIATVTPIENLTLMANYDYGHESSTAHGVAGTAGFDGADWQGLALYAKYDFSPKFSLAGRWEWFDDKDNVRVAVTGPGGTTLLGGIAYTEFTITSQYKFHEHLLARLEYRHDKADDRVFFHGGDGFMNTQDTIATELVAHF